MPFSGQNRIHPSGERMMFNPYCFFDGFLVSGADNRGIQDESALNRRGMGYIKSNFSDRTLVNWDGLSSIFVLTFKSA
jgi:hypothetical protein